MEHKLLGTLLIEQKQIKKKDLEQALALQKESNTPIGMSLVRLGALSEEQLFLTLSYQLNLPIISDSAIPENLSEINNALVGLNINSNWATANQAVVWFNRSDKKNKTELILAASYPLNIGLNEKLELSLQEYCKQEEIPSHQAHIARFLIRPNVLTHIFNYLSSNKPNDDPDYENLDTDQLRELAEEAPVIDYVNNIFRASVAENASDIHIEPYEDTFVVRHRVDGILQLRDTQPKSKYSPIASRIKLLSGMDIAENRLPQDGRQSIRFAGETLDLRVSSLPGTWGESLVLRLLRKTKLLPDLNSLGMSMHTQSLFTKMLQLQNGVVLVTGPTGSGKSTTLYKALDQINNETRKLITIEDPVEYNMLGITQIQIKPSIGYTFAKGLKAILRQDPDVIMVGEIRDTETASISIQAALTGHVVFSTLHTNSSLDAIERLIDLGMESFLVAAGLKGIVAQRLVRKLCAKCAKPSSGDKGSELLSIAKKSGAVFHDELNSPAQWKIPVGCTECNQTGYSGRIAIYEIVLINNELQRAIIKRSPRTELLSIARGENFLTLIEDGLLKARQGITSTDEIIRVVGETHEGIDKP